MRPRLCALLIAVITIPIAAASSEGLTPVASPGMMIGCVFGMKGDDPAKRTGIAIFISKTGMGRQPLSSDQVFDPDHLLRIGGFNAIDIGNGRSELTGSNKMLLKFLGGEIYEGVLNDQTSPTSTAWCIVSSQADAKSGFADFTQTLGELRRPPAGEGKSQ